MRIVITGATGFIGRNLHLRVLELGAGEVLPVTRETSADDRRAALARADVVIHLAGINRPQDPAEFMLGNAQFTDTLCTELAASGRAVPMVFASSIQAALDNPYGRSKRAAEEAVLRYGERMNARVAILRLANVFGKWSRPNYNSVVATFCYNTARGLPITISDPESLLRLVHIDDVIDTILLLVSGATDKQGIVAVGPVYESTVGEVASAIQGFAESRRTLSLAPVGTGFLRALYSTYVSYLRAEDFSYGLLRHEDPRGSFAEVMRTADAGQFSVFTAHPGVTRGGHYHHTKTERFLVVQGSARFRFRHVVTGERLDLTVTGAEARIVETVPGWAHDITNSGNDELIVMLWANEVFDPQKPDTIMARVTE
jgi:UDP-2-acetamido-2,6-beta-L-arabino-hexul-4-ose reductase